MARTGPPAAPGSGKMGEWIELKAADGHGFDAWRATPAAPRGAAVVLQEIFGVNGHIRALVEDFAAQGYDTVAPALYDRIGPGIELGYGDDDVARGRDLRSGLGVDAVMADVAAARDAVAGSGEVGVVGYCWGGTLAWIAASRLDIACAVGYYGSMTIDFIDEAPRSPMTLMLGETDATFPAANVETIAVRHPETAIFTYPAGHGFACDERESWREPSARLARERTLDIFTRYLG